MSVTTPFTHASSRSLVARASRRARARERGAVIFIVSMTLALLASLGLYALGNARTEVRTAGYEKQALQNQYLSEYGTLAVTQNMTADIAQQYSLLMLDPVKRTNNCISIKDAQTSGVTDLSKACKRLGRDEIASLWSSTTTMAIRPSWWWPAGSLGAWPNATDGDFFVEMSEPTQIARLAGYSLNWCSLQFTLTSFGVTRSYYYSNETSRFAGQGMSTSRARITAGPFFCP